MKRGTLQSGAKTPLPRKTRPKTRPKATPKRFNPLDYLNSLIEVAHDHRQDTARRRVSSSARRELTSALARTTPQSERTHSSAKMRSSSAYSQYRRKSVNLKEQLRLELGNLVSEEDVVRFTELTARGREEEVGVQAVRVPPLGRAAAARKIQRAWRRWQTLKVVRGYYEKYCGLVKQELGRREEIKKEEGSTGRQECDRTLRIRKDNHSNSNSQKNSPTTILKLPRPLLRALNFQEEIVNAETRELVRSEDRLRTIDLGVESVGYGSYESSGSSQGSLEQYQGCNSRDLQGIVEMFRSSHDAASREVQQQLSVFCRAQAALSKSPQASSFVQQRGSSLFQQASSSSSVFQGISPLVFVQMQAVIRRKFSLLQRRVQLQAREGLLDADQRRRALEQVEGRLQRELRGLNHCREQYMRSVRQLREGMLKMQSDCAWVDRLEGAGRVRRSYSAETLLMRSILEEVTARNKEIGQSCERQEPLLEYGFRRKGEEGVGLAFPTSPPSVVGGSFQPGSTSGVSLNCYQFDSDIKLRQALLECSAQSIKPCRVPRVPPTNQFQSQQDELTGQLQQNALNCSSSSSLNLSLGEHSLRQQESNHMVRECSQQIQQRIEAALVQEVVLELYGSVRFWGGFRSSVEKPFTFKAVSDWDIRVFLQKELPKYFQEEAELFRRVNQKINPTTLQILRLIRDFDFQVDEYELVLPEEVFKGYRRCLQEQYTARIKMQQESKAVVGVGGAMAGLVAERGAQRSAKRAKFISFERDLRIMYMKAVFNCLNESIIQTKAFYTFMNGRSSIGPGQLTLALKEYNWECPPDRLGGLMGEARERVLGIVGGKCSLAEFKSQQDLQAFRMEMGRQIVKDLDESEYKWVNYMDEVMEIWQELSLGLVEGLIEEVVCQIAAF